MKFTKEFIIDNLCLSKEASTIEELEIISNIINEAPFIEIDIKKDLINRIDFYINDRLKTIGSILFQSGDFEKLEYLIDYLTELRRKRNE